MLTGHGGDPGDPLQGDGGGGGMVQGCRKGGTLGTPYREKRLSMVQGCWVGREEGMVQGCKVNMPGMYVYIVLHYFLLKCCTYSFRRRR